MNLEYDVRHAGRQAEGVQFFWRGIRARESRQMPHIMLDTMVSF